MVEVEVEQHREREVRRDATGRIVPPRRGLGDVQTRQIKPLEDLESLRSGSLVPSLSPSPGLKSCGRGT